MGMIYQIQGKITKAIDAYLVALENSKDPEYVNELLDIAYKSSSPMEENTLDNGLDFLCAPKLMSEIEMELDDSIWI